MIFICLLPALGISAQFYSAGTSPSLKKWSHIKTDHYNLIYPTETDSLARVYLRNLETVRPWVMEALKIDPKRIDVILQPYETVSNGMVVWAPKRMVLYPTPDAYGSNSMPWAWDLVIHESRHVGQCEHFTKGFPGVASYIIGQAAPGLIMGIFGADFIMEGDAVFAESELTLGGRGRSAALMRYTRSLFLTGEYPIWERMRQGSFYRKAPNAYEFGYFMMSANRKMSMDYFHTGKTFKWSGTQVYCPVTIGKKKELTGTPSRSRMLDYANQMWTEVWKKDLEERGEPLKPDTVLSRKENLYTEYHNPIYINNPDSKYHGKVLAIKSGIQHAYDMVAIDSLSRERFVHFFGSVTSSLSYHQESGQIVWSELDGYQKIQRDRSIVRKMDLKTGRIRSFGGNTRYFNPTFSPTADTIAVAEYSIDGNTFLVFLDGKKGKPVSRIEAPKGWQIVQTAYYKGEIYNTIVNPEGLGIYRLDASGPKWEPVVAPQHQSIENFDADEESLYFVSDLDGVENIYRYYPETNVLLSMTNSAFGVTDPSFDENGTLYYCEYDKMGFRVAKSAVESLRWMPAHFDKPYKWPVMEMLDSQRRFSSKLPELSQNDTVDVSSYRSGRYSKFLGAFNIHTWAPVYFNVAEVMNGNFSSIESIAAPGVVVYSQNTMETVSFMAGYAWHKSWESGHPGGYHAGHFDLNWNVLGVDLHAAYDLNAKSSYDYFRLSDDRRELPYGSVTKGVVNSDLTLTLSRPISFYRGGTSKTLTPAFGYHFSNDRYFDPVAGEFIQRHEMVASLQYYMGRPVAKGQLFPRWGLGMAVRGAYAPGRLFGSQVFAQVYGYLPGILRRQGLLLRAQYQREWSDSYFLSSAASLPRGYVMLPQQRPGFQYFKVSADYAIPIWLGDVAIPYFLYLKRARLIPFVDYARNYMYKTVDMLSYGFEFSIDFNLFRYVIPITAGIRYSRTGLQPHTDKVNWVDFVFSISLP